MKCSDKQCQCICCKKIVLSRLVEVTFEGFLEGFSTVAKIDTGAYTGSLHVEHIEEKNDKLYFRPFSNNERTVSTDNYRKKWVRPSTGEKQTRYVIYVPAKIGGLTSELELTLANRAEMRNEMLIGRKNLANKYIVDVSL